MSKSAKTTASKKVSKITGITLCEHGINPKFCVKCKAVEATELKITPDEIKGISPKAKVPAAIYIPKSTGIANLGETICNEAVGIHFSIAKGALADGVPSEGDLVAAHVKGQVVPLVVRVSKPKVSGDLFIQAFLVEKGSGHHEILGAAKGSMVKVQWF